MATIAIDVETNARDQRCDPDFKVLGVSYASNREDGYISIGHSQSHGKPRELVLQELRCVLERYTRFVFHNAKYDLGCLERLGISLWDSNWYDTMLMQHMVDENIPNKSLDYLGKLHFNEGKEKDEQFKAFLNSFGWAFMPQWMIEPYAIQDAKLTLKLFHYLFPEFERQGFG